MPDVSAPTDFAELCSTLYGPYVDAEALWVQVSKLDDGQQREKLERNIARTSNVVGLAAGLAGTGSAVSSYRSLKAKAKVSGLKATSRKVPSKVGRLAVPLAGAAAGLQVLNVAGDAITTRVLARSSKKPPVEKVYTPKHGKTVKGRLQAMRRVQRAAIDPDTMIQTPTPPTPGSVRPNVPSNAPGPLTAAQREAMGTGASVRAGFDQLTSSTAGKVAVGTAGTGLYAHGRRKGRQKGIVEGYYAKSDVEIEGTFSKVDEDKRRAYGWASVVSLNGNPVIDRQGDFIGLDDIEEAAYTYVRKSRVAGRMHERDELDQPKRAGELIESMVFTPDKCHAMGLPASFSGKWWMGVQLEDEDAWQRVKKGEWTGFSIHGKGLRKDVAYDDVMAGR